MSTPTNADPGDPDRDARDAAAPDEQPETAGERSVEEPASDGADEKETVAAASSRARSARTPARSETDKARTAGKGRATTSRAEAAAKKTTKPNAFAQVALFVRQVVAELKKVVRPTRSELFTYIAVVIVFVIAIMAYVGVLDFLVGKLVLWAFGN